MKILAVATVFSFEPDLLRQSLQSYANSVEDVVICDNNPSSEGGGYEFLKEEFNNLTIITNHKNEGIAKPFNRVWKNHVGQGYEYLLTMDQDSIFDDFEKYKRKVEEANNESTIYASNYNHNVEFNDKEDFKKLDKFITSGTLIPFGLLEKLDGFCEDFLVDAIDIDFCVRASKEGIDILCCRYGNIEQRFGHAIPYKFMGRKLIGSEYSLQRLHDIFRNHIIIYRRYNHPPLVKRLLFDYCKRLITCIIVAEPDKRKKLAAIANGVIDGMTFKV